MFFRRETTPVVTFESRLETLRTSGFAAEPLGAGRIRVVRGGCAAVIEDVPKAGPRIVARAGVWDGEAIATLVDGGFQKFLETSGGKRRPALASDLRAIHSFQEDLREALGLTSLYNESLGTVSNAYLYDRVKDRDRGVPKRPWE
jgi:hypothetical protein